MCGAICLQLSTLVAWPIPGFWFGVPPPSVKMMALLMLLLLIAFGRLLLSFFWPFFVLPSVY